MQKKIFVFYIIVMLLLTGCTKITDDLDMIVDNVFSGADMVVNTPSTSYELYLPTGVKQEFDSQYNQKFKIKDRDVFLYVDTISFFYQNNLNYKQEDDYNYYFKKINNDGKEGYIGIEKVEDDLYFTEIVYNYSKMEFYSDKKNLPVILANSLIIIKNIKYNSDLISMSLNETDDDGRKLKYQLDSPEDDGSKFSDFLQEYVSEEEEKVESVVELPDAE